MATVLEGNVVWYFKTGKVQSKLRYKNGKQIGYYTVLEGTKGSGKEYQSWYTFEIQNNKLILIEHQAAG